MTYPSILREALERAASAYARADKPDPEWAAFLAAWDAYLRAGGKREEADRIHARAHANARRARAHARAIEIHTRRDDALERACEAQGLSRWDKTTDATIGRARARKARASELQSARARRIWDAERAALLEDTFALIALGRAQAKAGG